jgi:hypothetical protein
MLFKNKNDNFGEGINEENIKGGKIGFVSV